MVVVQQARTGLFFGKAGGWVKAVADARDFRRAQDAVAYCTLERLVDVRVGLISDDPALDVYFEPFTSQNGRKKSRKLRRKNQALRKKQGLLKGDIERLTNEIAQQSTTLPMRRKQKRRQQPAEGAGAGSAFAEP